MNAMVISNLQDRIEKIRKINTEICKLQSSLAAILMQTEAEFGVDSEEAEKVRMLLWG